MSAASQATERSGPVLTTARAAAYCGIAKQTLYNLISEGKRPGVDFPRYFKQGRLNVFYAADLDEFLSNRITPACAA
ncbi:helix-turn-helix domain-containing protein [Microbacterium arborescens]|uniref:helix-turn-helix domain-containing protein n=1 Tax=Microbacterium arborescens TaxID=33883 RepID=UPI003C732147